MNNIDDGTEKKETRIKLIRNESVGEYSWDTSDSTVNLGEGVNEWNNSKISILLNNFFFYKKANQNCYNGSANATTNCDFSTIGLSLNAQDLVTDAKWHTGSNGYTEWNTITSRKFYELERSNNTGKICTSGVYCTDNVERKTTWIGKIGLMYPSDYGFATSGGKTKNKDICLNTIMYDWNTSEYADCKNNNWLYKLDTFQWTMMPVALSSNSNETFHIRFDGRISYRPPYNTSAIVPTLFLKSNVKIISGNGYSSQPFQLEQG